MNRILFIMAVLALPIGLSAQSTPGGLKATLKISNMHVEVNGEKVEWDKTYEVPLTHGVESKVVLYEQKGLQYGSVYTYKRGKNRLKLVRRGFAVKSGSDPVKAKQKKDMQVMRTSIPGNLEKRVVENIIVDKNALETINVSYNYELIYK